MILSQCMLCKHLSRPGTGHGLQCAAFPKGIPEDIYANRHDHSMVYPGDGGILWEPASEEDARTWSRLKQRVAREPSADPSASGEG